MVEKTKATLSNVALRNQEKLYKITVSSSKYEKDYSSSLAERAAASLTNG